MRFSFKNVSLALWITGNSRFHIERAHAYMFSAPKITAHCIITLTIRVHMLCVCALVNNHLVLCHWKQMFWFRVNWPLKAVSSRVDPVSYVFVLGFSFFLKRLNDRDQGKGGREGGIGSQATRRLSVLWSAQSAPFGWRGRVERWTEIRWRTEGREKINRFVDKYDYLLIL